MLVRSKIPELDPESLQPLVEIEPGEWYSAGKVDTTILALTEAAGTKGYAFVEVRPMVDRNREDRSIDVTFAIEEGQRESGRESGRERGCQYGSISGVDGTVKTKK